MCFQDLSVGCMGACVVPVGCSAPLLKRERNSFISSAIQAACWIVLARDLFKGFLDTVAEDEECTHKRENEVEIVCVVTPRAQAARVWREQGGVHSVCVCVCVCGGSR